MRKLLTVIALTLSLNAYAGPFINKDSIALGDERTMLMTTIHYASYFDNMIMGHVGYFQLNNSSGKKIYGGYQVAFDRQICDKHVGNATILTATEIEMQREHPIDYRLNDQITPLSRVIKLICETMQNQQ